MKPKVYLAGPISGLTLDDAQDWRDSVRAALAPEIEGFSPLRGKKYLQSAGILEGSYEQWPMSTARAILERDHWDCRTADAILVNLIGAGSISKGTIMEIAFASAYRKPLVLAMEKTGNPHDHPMVVEAATARVYTLADTIVCLRTILLP